MGRSAGSCERKAPALCEVLSFKTGDLMLEFSIRPFTRTHDVPLRERWNSFGVASSCDHLVAYLRSKYDATNEAVMWHNTACLRCTCGSRFQPRMQVTGYIFLHRTEAPQLSPYLDIEARNAACRKNTEVPRLLGVDQSHSRSERKLPSQAV